jgi:acetolactate synthase I/III small subunit
MRHTLSVLVENQPGVLARVSGLFSRRGFNIESLAVSITDDTTVSRMTIVVEGDAAALEQITKQLHKLIEIIKVHDYTNAPVVERELALIKVNASEATRPGIMQIADIFRGKIVDVSERSFIVEVTGAVDKVDALEALLKPYGILEVVRTGKILLQRGARAG